jgi:protein-S-isoprenylcysteine O-methyltransferase Ste14
MTNQLYVFLFVLLFVGIVFFLRSYLLWKNTGTNPMMFGSSDDAHDFNLKLFKFIFLMELAVAGIYSFGEDYYQYLLPFWYLENFSLRTIGWVLLHFALIWTFISQLQMADSWRIGIDTKRSTDLVTQGLFSYSRNPIFLGIIIADLGLFLVIPNAFTFWIASISIVAIQIQVRLEEVHLRKEHGDQYTKYCKEVRRWI